MYLTCDIITLLGGGASYSVTLNLEWLLSLIQNEHHCKKYVSKFIIIYNEQNNVCLKNGINLST